MKTNDNFLMMDTYKKVALKQVIAKEKESRVYPISKSDLLFIKKCPLCRSKNTEPIAELYINYELKILSTDICNECLFVFRSTSPNLGWFKKCWEIIKTKNLEVFNPKVEDLRKNRYEKYYNILSKYVKSGKALDIGAAYGTGTNIFRNHGFDVEAVEPEINKINYLKQALKIPLASDSIEGLVEQRRPYDLVLFSQCFEHIDHPDFIMSNIKNLLRDKKSILYLEIPIIWNYINWSDALYLPHKSNLTEDNIVNLIANNGFRILEMFYLWDQSLWGQSIEGQSQFGKPSDMGMVLQYTGSIPAQPLSDKIQKYNKEGVRSLYHKDLPASAKTPINKTIKYSVPHINQFFQTLRLENKKIIRSKIKPDFLIFEDIKK